MKATGAVYVDDTGVYGPFPTHGDAMIWAASRALGRPVSQADAAEWFGKQPPGGFTAWLYMPGAGRERSGEGSGQG